MKIIKKIFLVIIILIISLSADVYAKYNYTYNFRAFSLSRDNSEITYNIIKTGESNQYTNKDILLTIDLNKSVEPIEGFSISEDGKRLTRLISENENKTIVVQDVSGNKKEIAYNIDNIDKIPPEIIGVENGAIYNPNKSISYRDNVGIKDIYIDKYSKLNWVYYPDYYDTDYYKGIDVTDKSVTVNLVSHPRSTSYYKYYLDGNLKAQTEQTKFKITGLVLGTEYEVKVEALDKENNILETVTKFVKTKNFSSVQAEKFDESFKVTVSGIDSKIERALAIAYTKDDPFKEFDVQINPDRSLNVKFSPYIVTPTIENKHYFFHIEFYENEKLLETLCCNVIFNTNYVPTENSLDPYNLKESGNYQIIVTDLAGNSTTKDITISDNSD